MSNQLRNSTSPYLLQHADNPVDWYEWGQEAFDRAQAENKPIFLSIGYAACHWCHVMAHESFEDPATASLMNQFFINIKLDREERPDVDSIYMDAVVALTGQGGWPMSVFLTPDRVPFYGGTYFPPEPRHGLPSFQQLLEGIHKAWIEDPAGLTETGEQLRDHLTNTIHLNEQEIPLKIDQLTNAARALFETYDWNHGGWGAAPKFPQSTAIELLLRLHARKKDALSRDMATHALTRMARGGMYDLVGGGFHRYSVDDNWLVPHFEKMLYDNALLAAVYTNAWVVTEKANFRGVAEQTVEFILRELRDQKGGFYSSLDADSEGIEGKFYVWSIEEVREILGSEADLFIQRYGLSETGNFESQNILFEAVEPSELAGEFETDVKMIEDRLRNARLKLLQVRAERVWPGLDDKVLAGWNGLTLVALSRAARIFDRSDFLQASQELADFILTEMMPHGMLMRSWRDGQARFPAFLEDHATVGLGMLELYRTDFDERWYVASIAFADEILDKFADPQGGFFDTKDDHEQLISRPKSIQDTPIPSGNSLAYQLLLQLSELSGDEKYGANAESALASVQSRAARYPSAFAGWLINIDFALGPTHQLAIVGDPQSRSFKDLLRIEASLYLPRLVLAGGTPDDSIDIELLQQRTMIGQEATAYLCQNFVCNLPTNQASKLQAQLQQVIETEAAKSDQLQNNTSESDE